MPIYSYQCDQCQAQFEVRASFQEKDLGLKPVCPHCESPKTHQLLSFGLFIHSGNDGRSSQSSPFCGPNSGSGCCGG